MKNILIYHIVHFGKTNFYLDAWLRDCGCVVETVISKFDVTTMRRACLEEFKRRDFDYMMMVDEDICPDTITAANILHCEGDAVYCATTDSYGKKAHWGPGDFQLAFFRLSKSLALRLDTPNVFDFEYNKQRTVRTRCSCAVFADLLKSMGVETKQVGIVGHPVTVIAYPTKTGRDIKWPIGT